MRGKWYLGAWTGVALALATQIAKADVAVYGVPGAASWNADVVSKITAASGGRLGTVVNHVLCQTTAPCEPTPTLAQLQAYTSVLVYSDLGFQDPAALGNVLADYVDGGGRVVIAIFALSPGAIAGRFASEGYFPITLGSQRGISNGNLVAVDAENPILDGVSSFRAANKTVQRSAGI